ncbi:MAG: hypothetical protein P1V51_04715 [Deltaproteobacteria bacterium]|nr:hypothetical protein [Deltaproteobacteria bacterium]
MPRAAKRTLLIGLGLLALSGCTVVNTAIVPGAPHHDKQLFVTTGDLKVPYESLGPLQITRKGVYVFGFLDPAGFDLEPAFHEAFLPEARKLGADGVINVQFEQTQYTLFTKILGAVFFFAPLPAEVTIRGEAVRLVHPPGQRVKIGETREGELLALAGGE